MTKRELEERIKALEARIAQLEARPVYVPYPYPATLPSTAAPSPIQPQWWYQYPAISSISGSAGNYS